MGLSDRHVNAQMDRNKQGQDMSAALGRGSQVGLGNLPPAHMSFGKLIDPPAQSEIQSLLNGLTVGVSALDHELGLLRDRLTPVTKSSTASPEKDSAEARLGMSDVGAQLQSETARIRAITHLVAGLRESLAV